MFVGYPTGQKGWRVYDPDKKVFFISRDVIFYESEFPFKTIDLSSGRPSISLPVLSSASDDDWNVEDIPLSTDRGSSENPVDAALVLAGDNTPSQVEPTVPASQDVSAQVESSLSEKQNTSDATEIVSDVSPSNIITEELVRGLRNKIAPAKF